MSRIDASLCGTLVFFVFICDVDHVFKVKDGLKILHLRLANARVEERKIKNRPFSGVNLTRFDLIERHT